MKSRPTPQERERRIAEHLDAIRQLQRDDGTDGDDRTWPPQGFYWTWHLMVGITLGGLGALVSLALNVVGAPLFGEPALQLVRVYLTFPMGEAALVAEARAPGWQTRVVELLGDFSEQFGDEQPTLAPMATWLLGRAHIAAGDLARAEREWRALARAPEATDLRDRLGTELFDALAATQPASVGRLAELGLEHLERVDRRGEGRRRNLSRSRAHLDRVHGHARAALDAAQGRPGAMRHRGAAAGVNDGTVAVSGFFRRPALGHGPFPRRIRSA